MARFEFADHAMNDYFDVVVEVDFAETLTPIAVHHVLQHVVGVTSGRLAAFLFEGFSYVRVDAGTMRLDFRFARGAAEPPLSGEAQEDRSRQQVQFIFYVFADINRRYALATPPFPVGYEAFSQMPAELGFDS